MPQPDGPRHDPPLQFSVHSLPGPDAALAQRTRLGRLKMLMVWAVCAAPVVASYVSYNLLRPEGRNNYGTLIMPPHALPSEAGLRLTGEDGRVVRPAELKGQWLLVAVAGGACDAQCEQQLYWQRQLRESLGKDKERLDRVWLIPDRAPLHEGILPGLQQAWVLRVSPSDLAGWLQPAPGEAVEAHLYLIDPRGDWMMRFPAHADPARVKKDLARLMKANESWDQAGR